jgi:hypothetical protein
MRRAVGSGFFLGCLLLAMAAAPWAAEFGRLGVALKMGESAGIGGAQVAWNFSPHLQVCAGRGGVALDFLSSDFDVDSYFLMGKYYLRHVYFATGYAQKIAFAETREDGRIYGAAIAEHGIPFHAGYEFGIRKGFFFSASMGLVYIPGGGGRSVEKTTPSGNAVSATSVKTGPSLGFTLGYYLL